MTDPAPNPHETLALALSENVDTAMRRHGVSQRQLMQRSGVSRASIENILKARHSATMRTLVAIAAALDCDLVVQFAPRGGTKD